MRRLRFLLACLMMLAVPLQGFAAASMLMCGPLQGHASAPVQGHAAPHGHGHSHDHALSVPGAAVHDGHPASHPGAHATHVDASHGQPPAGDMPHKCGVCAACCHAVAIAETRQVACAETPRQPRLDEPVASIATRAITLPDKPPRA